MLMHLHAQLLHLLLTGLFPKSSLQVGLHEIVLLLRIGMPFQTQNMRVWEIVVGHPLAEVVRYIHSQGDSAGISTSKSYSERVLEVHEDHIAFGIAQNVAMLQIMMAQNHLELLLIC